MLWAARFAMEPPDAANRYAMVKMKYEPPDDVQDLIEEYQEKHPVKRRPKFLTARALRRRMKRAR